MSNVSLDHAATTPLAACARDAMRPYLEEEFGNPSSRHPLGIRAAEALDRAREQLARALLVPARQVVFTSGGTEAANLAVLGCARAAHAHGRHVLVGATEHACVRGAAKALAREGFEVETLRLTPAGDLDLEDLARRLRADTVLLAQMLANNEFGTLYPVRRAAQLVRARARHAKVVVDCVQAFGKLDCAPRELGVDLLAVAGHKLYAPKGVGALYLRRGTLLAPLLLGAGHERGLRPGTENVAGCVGFGAAVEHAERGREATVARLRALRARLREAVAALPGARLLEPGAELLPSILAAVLPGVPAEVRLHHLARRGVFVGTGSACQAAKNALSPALLALGLGDEESRRVLRFSLGATTTEDEIERAARAMASGSLATE